MRLTETHTVCHVCLDPLRPGHGRILWIRGGFRVFCMPCGFQHLEVMARRRRNKKQSTQPML